MFLFSQNAKLNPYDNYARPNSHNYSHCSQSKSFFLIISKHFAAFQGVFTFKGTTVIRAFHFVVYGIPTAFYYDVYSIPTAYRYIREDFRTVIRAFREDSINISLC